MNNAMELREKSAIEYCRPVRHFKSSRPSTSVTHNWRLRTDYNGYQLHPKWHGIYTNNEEFRSPHVPHTARRPRWKQIMQRALFERHLKYKSPARGRVLKAEQEAGGIYIHAT